MLVCLSKQKTQPKQEERLGFYRLNVKKQINTFRLIKSKVYSLYKKVLEKFWWFRKNVYLCCIENHLKIKDMNQDININDEHEQDGSGDYLCDCCNEPVNKEDWCFTCKDYVYVHHIND